MKGLEPKLKKAFKYRIVFCVLLFTVAWISVCGQAPVMSSKPINVSSVNSPDDDYWPTISADNHYFATTVSHRGESVYQATQEDLTIFEKDSVGNWKPDSVLTKPLNTPYNEGSPAFSADGRYLFFVAADRKDGLGSCDIYYVIRHGNRWSQPIHADAPLNTRFWESNPSLSADGRTLFFVSNRTGGKGGMDIWKCAVAVQSDGLLRFFNAENLGDSINTAKNEMSPFIHPDNETLYFSSNGHGGYGGNDIFVARKNQIGQWKQPVNLGNTINTPGDDTGFVVETGGRYGFFSTNGLEQNGKGREIYKVELPVEVRPRSVICFEGITTDAANKEPLRALVEVTDLSSGQKIQTLYADDVTGKFSVCYPVGKKYGLTVSAKPYLFESFELGDSSKNVKVALQKIAKGRKTTLRNVYFAFNSWQLQPESMPELKRLGRFLLEYPSVKILIEGHTDNVGTESYNMELSGKRAKAVVDFLMTGGIAADRVNFKGYGATRPLATNDTEQGRALNRRTEIEIE
ncbi:OmpA family protein [Paludibacter jiangxiensis]|uniref:OmpA family protein n=1 Tax=Paludibacter jiangxiensis TaxID=681398 RepID=UPI00155E9BED|nr:OmpA family protein [Paludibacter jiangxiensis]